MTFRNKILLLTVLPMLIGMISVATLISYQARQLSQRQSEVFHEALLDIHKSELKSFTKLAQSSLTQIIENATLSDTEKRLQAKHLLGDLAYADDGYFFVYDREGQNLVHPKQPYRVGMNWWGLVDSEGKPIIQDLISQAESGGGFTNYLWEQPSSGLVSKKLGYAEMLYEWDWVLGTGVYIDSIDQQLDKIDVVFNNQIRSTAIIIIAITALAVVAVVLSGLVLQLNERKLADHKQQLLTKRVLDTQDEERRRVSRELHDGISQRLVAIKYSLEEARAATATSKTQGQTLIGISEQYIDDTIIDVRRMSHDLHPSILDDLGLMVAVESLVDQFSKRTELQVNLVTVPFRNLLSIAEKTALYRVTQEAFSNIERHANAHSVNVNFELTDSWFQLTIHDDGDGFDQKSLSSNSKAEFSLGLRNMSERMSYFQGRLKISSTTKGTTICAAIPRSSLKLKANSIQANS